MKRIKLFTNKQFDDWQPEIDAWIDSEKPNIIEMKVSPECDSTYTILFVLYDDGKMPNAPNDFAQ